MPGGGEGYREATAAGRQFQDRTIGTRRHGEIQVEISGIVLEVCPTSNVTLGVYSSYAAHPFGALRDAGVAVTLGSDDPPYFGASIGGEYAVAAQHFGLDKAALLAVTRTAVGASFADPGLREKLLDRLHSG